MAGSQFSAKTLFINTFYFIFVQELNHLNKLLEFLVCITTVVLGGHSVVVAWRAVSDFGGGGVGIVVVDVTGLVVTACPEGKFMYGTCKGRSFSCGLTDPIISKKTIK